MSSDPKFTFGALGNKVSSPSKNLETFPAPDNVTEVEFETDEVTSLCPVTGQPDFQTVIITYTPDGLCLESKSLKLYLWSFRNEAAFCESLAAKIAADIFEAIKPYLIVVTIKQKPRGGISLTATSILKS